MAQWIKADGSIEEVEPKNGTDFQYEELREFVGGYIEMVHPLDSNLNQVYDRYIVLNEEGKLLGLPINFLATNLYNNPQDVIVGNVLVCSSQEVL